MVLSPGKHGPALFPRVFHLVLVFLCVVLPCQAFKLPKQINYTVHNLFPEGLDWDYQDERFFVSSSREAAIYEVSPDGTTKLFVKEEELASKACMRGLRVDTFRSRDRVLVSLHTLNESQPFDAVAAYNVHSGARLFLVRLDTLRPGPSNARDVTVDLDGNIYVTNGAQSFIWKINLEGDALVFTKSGAFGQHGVPSGADLTADGLNGLDIMGYADIVVSQANTGSIFRVALSDGTVTPIQLKGLLVDPQHLRLISEDRMVVLERSSVTFVTTTDEWESAEALEEIALPEFDSPTAVSFANRGQIFVTFGHLQEAFKGVDRADFRILRVDFKELEVRENHFEYYVFAFTSVTVILIWLFVLHLLAKRFGNPKAEKQD
eukprot:TRINITY_DN3247_c0_g1_i1.p1 TRINITY_DN3247_c0_g1~~TRINITY_DN3247_c0_g1_i1.p1  ORF type:complete len:377 (+),score=63.62 TRINITY_DN3247_c0_g1_i1:108-1238(+)